MRGARVRRHGAHTDLSTAAPAHPRGPPNRRLGAGYHFSFPASVSIPMVCPRSGRRGTKSGQGVTKRDGGRMECDADPGPRRAARNATNGNRREERDEREGPRITGTAARNGKNTGNATNGNRCEERDEGRGIVVPRPSSLNSRRRCLLRACAYFTRESATDSSNSMSEASSCL